MGMIGPKEKKQKKNSLDGAKQFLDLTQTFQKVAQPTAAAQAPAPVTEELLAADLYDQKVSRNKMRR
jgi:hypothetical protein